MKQPERCLGYKEAKCKCSNKAGTAWSPYWCHDCNQKRMDTISKNLEDIDRKLKPQTKGAQNE